MTIKQIAKTTGISVHTLRYYEKINLIPPVPRNENGIRNYDEHFIDYIIFIQELKQMGMTLRDIHDYMLLAKLGKCSSEKRKVKLLQIKQILSEKIRHIQMMMNNLEYHLEHYNKLLLPETDYYASQFDI